MLRPVQDELWSQSSEIHEQRIEDFRAAWSERLAKALLERWPRRRPDWSMGLIACFIELRVAIKVMSVFFIEQQ